jgi:hypothetical protein
MGTHMEKKTTLDLPYPLLEETKGLAARDGTTVRALVEEGLRKVIAERRRESAFRLRDASFKGRGLHPDVAEGSWERVRALAYQGRGG